MNLWSVGIVLDEPDLEIRKERILQAVTKERAFGPGTLTGSTNGYYSVIFGSSAATADELLARIRKNLALNGSGDINVFAHKLRPQEDWAVEAEALGVDADALESTARLVYEDATACKLKTHCIEMLVSVEGFDEAIKLLKILEAQLQNVQGQAERISQAIDALNLKLESRIKGMRVEL